MPSLLQITAILLAAAATPAGNPMKPLKLHVGHQGDANVIRVVGLSDKASSIPYDLQVTDGGNRSVQRGIAHLHPGVQTTVATVTLVSDRRIAAELKVKSGDTEYIEQFGQP